MYFELTLEKELTFEEKNKITQTLFIQENNPFVYFKKDRLALIAKDYSSIEKISKYISNILPNQKLEIQNIRTEE